MAGVDDHPPRPRPQGLTGALSTHFCYLLATRNRDGPTLRSTWCGRNEGGVEGASETARGERIALQALHIIFMRMSENRSVDRTAGGVHVPSRV